MKMCLRNQRAKNDLIREIFKLLVHTNLFSFYLNNI